MSRDLLQQALDALETKYSDRLYDGAGPAIAGAFEADIAALRAALAQPQAEPVAWGMLRADGLVLDVICPQEHEEFAGDYTVPLYATPQQARPAPAAPAVQPLQSQLDEARADADRRHQLLGIQHAEAVELWNALEDLSFECDGVTRCIAPSRETYNRTFAVLRRKNHLSPEALRGYGSSGLQQQSVQFADGIAAPGSAG